MSDFFLGEIRLFPMAKPPSGWLLCNGAVLQIQQYTALYSLLQTNYGGDGVKTFQLPDLCGRAAIQAGQAIGGTYVPVGTKAGLENVVLTTANIPLHTHAVNATTSVATAASPKGNLIAATVTAATPSAAVSSFANATTATPVALAPTSIGNSGDDNGHNNMQPYLVLNYCIAVTGALYPTRP